MKKSEVNKYSYVILGAGRSGLGAAKLLKKNGAKVFLSDNSPLGKLMYFDDKTLKKFGIPFETGGHSDNIFDYDFFVKSPGIPLNSPVIEKALSLNKKVISEVEVAYWFCECPIIAITGTNGKTTTTVLTGEIFKNAGMDTKVCGNVGLAFSEVAGETKNDSVVVLEVSSFQLESTENFRPAVSMFLTFTADHIDWHGSMENYMNAKLKINRNQSDDDVIVFNYDDEKIKEQMVNFNANICGFSTKTNLEKTNLNCGCYVLDNEIFYFNKMKSENSVIMNTEDIFIRGNHNLLNSLAAISAAKSFGVSNVVIENTLKIFKGVEHRIEPVRDLNGVKFYNDSKATNFDSLYVALESFSGNIILIMGGKKGDNKFGLVEDFITKRVKKIFAIGQSGEAIKKYFDGKTEVEQAGTLDEAVKMAYKSSVNSDVVLFSPGYKSFDMFDNFEHRGSEFKKSVNKLKPKK
ncbi:MAG: UDP-N-acetylmuramoyl-L-alanine--D-glutamate ligase [Ignavibacteriae bacterium]|nr:UDP-N-acetylmuramoyl-L-alanine--D-glutamate ligase [Ignavibacteriota bacterium]